MSPNAKKELTKIVARRYLQAKSKKEKTKILDEYCANTGLNRKYGKAKTPYQRVMACPEIHPGSKRQLTALYHSLNPVKLRKNIQKKILKIISLQKSGF